MFTKYSKYVIPYTMLLIKYMCRKITSHWQPLFSKKMAAAASFSYKIGGGGKDLATLLAALLTWSGLVIFLGPTLPKLQLGYSIYNLYS